MMSIEELTGTVIRCSRADKEHRVETDVRDLACCPDCRELVRVTDMQVVRVETGEIVERRGLYYHVAVK